MKMATVAPKEVSIQKKIKEGLTEKELEDYRQTFNRFDADGGGTIDSDELGTLIRVLG